jgi:hypothetical protein
MGRETATEKGNAFRDLVASMLEAAGFRAETEGREEFKKVDVRWWREDLDGPLKYFVETKDQAEMHPREYREFLIDYGTLLERGHADRAWFVSKVHLSPDARALVDAKRGCKAMTFAEFQRRLLGVDSYLQDLIIAYDADRISDWYVRPHTDDGVDLEKVVRDWIDEEDALPLAIVAGYGKGKSTFARHIAVALAREALAEPWRRVPVLVPLGEIVDEQSLEGLLGKVFTSRPGVRGYNFGLFAKLNNAGRFVVIFDGFDEMKHGMTLARFEANITELMRLDRDAAKIVILGRDTAFHDDYEFKSIIAGRQITAAGQDVAARGRRPFRHVTIREFTVDEARCFVRRFFPVAAREANRGSANGVDEAWIAARTSELLSGAFDDLLARPVHAQMLCQIATDPATTLTGLSKYRLFDLFVHFLLEREVKKRGRDPRLSLDVRRKFNRSLALWLWSQGGVSTVTLASVPAEICRSATSGVRHDYDDAGLRKELTAGCLVEKGATGTIYFGHRSLQEFLVAEELIETNYSKVSVEDKGAALWTLALITPEVGSFIVEAAKSFARKRNIVSGWFRILRNLRRKDMPRVGMRFFMDLYTAIGDEREQAPSLPEGEPPPLPEGERACPALDPGSPVLQRGRVRGFRPFDEHDPWFIWLKYFAANQAVEFPPQTAAAVEQLRRTLGYLNHDNQEQQAAALILAAEALSRTSDARATFAVPFIAAWLRPQPLRIAVEAARRIGHNDHHYVSPDDDFLFWTFLHAAKVENDPLCVRVDLRELRKRAGSVLAIGFAEEQDEGFPADLRCLSATAQQIYRAWDTREAALEGVRPYFASEGLRVKIRPLEIIRTPHEDRAPIAPPTRPLPRKTLSLKNRGLQIP